jgi:hypothetical protein
MNTHNDINADDLEECTCMGCKGFFWVPYYSGLPDIGHPAFCPFCGAEFGWKEETK